jgi:hypothetical protein
VAHYNTDTNKVYRISLNIATNTERFKILTMFDYFEGCIEEVLQRAVAFHADKAVPCFPPCVIWSKQIPHTPEHILSKPSSWTVLLSDVWVLNISKRYYKGL